MTNKDERTVEAPSRRPMLRSRTWTASLLMVALAFQGLSGVVGGLGLLYDPTGETLGLPMEWLAGSPFPDYTVPGLVLLAVLGAGPLAAAWGVWTRRPWGRTGSVAVGLALVAWLGVEILVVGYQAEPPLQLIYGVVAAVILVLSPAASARPAKRRP